MRDTVNGLDREALVAGRYDTRLFRLGAKTKMMFTAAGRTSVRQGTERRIVLPNGHTVRVSRDASGCATQIEENDRLHGVARPETYRLKLTAHADKVDVARERLTLIQRLGALRNGR